MKIFRNDVCFVNIKDLIGYDLPDDLLFDKERYEENDYVIFKEKKDIDYINQREDIIDYDYVSALSNEELDEKIKRIEKDLEPLYIKYLSSDDVKRIQIFKDPEFKDMFIKLDKVYYDLIHYRNNREFEDNRVISLLSNNDSNVLVLYNIDKKCSK